MQPFKFAKRYKVLFLLAVLSIFNQLMGAEKPLSIVIIGGGPAGLATAIEAKEAGADVVVVEKRESYTRRQIVFLFDSSLQLLNKWRVSIPNMMIESEEDGWAFARINQLEEGLAQRVADLGIRILFGEFKGIREKNAIISHEGEEVKLPYDLLVGADGVESSVRKELGITTKQMGKAQGIIAIIYKENPQVDFFLPTWSESLYINNISLSTATVISAQGENLSKQQLAAAAREMGWLQEAERISSNKASLFENIDIALQKANQFSSREQAALLIGDSAAVGSFLQGMGANVALESAAIAGQFFRSEQKEKDYRIFNRAMKKATDRLIEDSAYLFRAP